MNNVNYLSTSEWESMNPELDLSIYTDATISGMISRASHGMDNYLQYSLGIEDIVAENTESIVSSKGNLIIFTRKFPIISVSAIRLKLGTVHLDLTLNDAGGNPRYDIPARGRSIVYPYQEIAMTGVFSIRNFYQMRDLELFTQISYRAGYETISNDIKDACNLWTKDIFNRQTNPMELSSLMQGAIRMEFKEKNSDGDGIFLRQAKNILQSYRRAV